MKKLLFAVLSLSLALIFALSGCSCATTQPLSFNKAYLGDVPSGSYYERLEYSVGYERTYQSITDSIGIDQNKMKDCNFNGTYVVEFSDSHNALPDGIETNLTYEPDYFCIKTTLNLYFTVNGKTYHDQMVGEVYFFSRDWSLAPVYSVNTSKYTYFYLDSDEPLPQVIYQTSTLYKKGKYTLTKMRYAPQENEDINNLDLTETDVNSPNYFDLTKLSAFTGNGKSYEYELKRVVDNAQLMFAIRNSDSNTANLPTISFSYDKPIDISAKKKNQANYTFNTLTYNGDNKDNTNMLVNNVEFYINTTNNRGSSKYLSIQCEEVNGIKNNALIVEYAEPLVSSISTIGALVYKLTNATVTTV